MFDCVMPTRNARNGHLFTLAGRGQDPQRRRTRRTPRPLDPALRLLHLPQLLRAYLRHLDRCNEILGARLNTIHNLHYYLDLMAPDPGGPRRGGGSSASPRRSSAGPEGGPATAGSPADPRV